MSSIHRIASAAGIQLPPLTKRKMTELTAKAKRVGMDPGDYAKRLIEDGLAFQRDAEESSFAEIMEPVRECVRDVSDSEISRVVESARADRQVSGRRKKR